MIENFTNAHMHNIHNSDKICIPNQSQNTPFFEYVLIVNVIIQEVIKYAKTKSKLKRKKWLRSFRK